MKVFFDTNVYVAEALLGQEAQRLVDATVAASWRIYTSGYLLDELERVIADKLGFSRRFAVLTRQRVLRRATLIELPASRHAVVADSADTPILSAALAAGADFLISNDNHLLALNPYESLRIISMTQYVQLLQARGHLTS